MPAVVEGDRLAPDRLVRDQVSERDDATATLHRRDDQVGGLALVEPVATAVRDALQHLGQFGRAPCGTDRNEAPILQEQRRARRVHPEPVRAAFVVVAEGRVHHETIARQCDGRCHHFGPRPSAELAMRLVEPRDRAGHAGGQRTGDAAIGDVASGVEIHVARGTARRNLAEVERDVLAVQPREHEPAATDVAGRRIGHGERHRDGDGRVHRVPRRRGARPDQPAWHTARQRRPSPSRRWRRWRGARGVGASRLAASPPLSSGATGPRRVSRRRRPPWRPGGSAGRAQYVMRAKIARAPSDQRRIGVRVRSRAHWGQSQIP